MDKKLLRLTTACFFCLLSCSVDLAECSTEQVSKPGFFARIGGKVDGAAAAASQGASSAAAAAREKASILADAASRGAANAREKAGMAAASVRSGASSLFSSAREKAGALADAAGRGLSSAKEKATGLAASVQERFTQQSSGDVSINGENAAPSVSLKDRASAAAAAAKESLTSAATSMKNGAVNLASSLSSKFSRGNSDSGVVSPSTPVSKVDTVPTETVFSESGGVSNSSFDSHQSAVSEAVVSEVVNEKLAVALEAAAHALRANG